MVHNKKLFPKWFIWLNIKPICGYALLKITFLFNKLPKFYTQLNLFCNQFAFSAEIIKICFYLPLFLAVTKIFLFKTLLKNLTFILLRIVFSTNKIQTVN